jgi:hypothetical protein
LLHCEIETSTGQGGTGVDLADASRRIHPASRRRSELTYWTLNNPTNDVGKLDLELSDGDRLLLWVLSAILKDGPCNARLANI